MNASYYGLSWEPQSFKQTMKLTLPYIDFLYVSSLFFIMYVCLEMYTVDLRNNKILICSYQTLPYFSEN